MVSRALERRVTSAHSILKEPARHALTHRACTAVSCLVSGTIGSPQSKLLADVPHSSWSEGLIGSVVPA